MPSTFNAALVDEPLIAHGNRVPDRHCAKRAA